uniref:Putative conserved secreted protein n=1 Tax=Panstrongylus lignarius TaxID=156445 RepID=A0A224XTU8_9HEMI
MKKILFAFTLVLFVAAEQNISTTLQELENSIPGMSQVFGGSLPSINEGDELLKEKCLKNGNNESYEIAMQAKQDFQTCLKEIIDFDVIQEEIDEAKPKGDLDTVFKKYCGKSPKLKACVKNATASVESCLDEGEKIHKGVFLDITDSLINFICYKEGDRIALFIAEGGPECLTSKAEVMQQCANETSQKYQKDITADGPTINFNETECMEFTEIQKCIVNHLEGCKEPTPANIVNSLFEFVIKRTPCSKYLNKAGSTSLQHTILSFVLPAFAIVISKL